MGQSTKCLKWKRKERKKMKEKKKLPKRQSAQSWVEIPGEVKVTCLLLAREAKSFAALACNRLLSRISFQSREWL